MAPVQRQQQDARPPELNAEAVAAIRAIAARVAAQVSLANATALLAEEVARILCVPLAILSRDDLTWRLEAHAFPDAPNGTLATLQRSMVRSGSLQNVADGGGHPWTAVALGALGDRNWALLLPGESAGWEQKPHFEEVVHDVSWSIGQVAAKDRADYAGRFQRKLHAFAHRLARETDAARLHSLVLRTLASQVQAQTGALAIFDPTDRALAIATTLGYPYSIVEHLRILPGQGLFGGVYESGRAMINCPGERDDAPRRLRYRTDSYMLLPVLEGKKCVAVIALTDRADGRPFDARDFAAARVMAAASAPAFSREQLRESVAELTELATVDPVTGLFNRRHFELRLDAEVERAKRQRQDLALLLIDIDDFKRVNDTRGHLEGDRTLRDVAELLRAGVRIFDVCARYGGEEFVIVMPGAPVPLAKQIAERIRARVERSFAQESPVVTISVGVGMLAPTSTSDQLIDAADRALISAKKAGKNLVWVGTESIE